ncbi:MAG: cell division protein ZapA [Hyphomicrobiales bacterium]
MGQVIVHVNGHPYTMQCTDGEEEHLRDLAQLLDAEVTRIRRSVGAVGDVRLLVMAGLMVADRLSEAIKRIEDVEAELEESGKARAILAQQTRDLEARLTERLDNASKRLEGLAKDMGLGH